MKKVNLFILFTIFLLGQSITVISQVKSRITTNFDFDWKFILDSSIDASSPTYNDLKWADIQVPHDWSIKFPLNEKNDGSMGFMPGGIGWYRKSFEIPSNYQGKKVAIRFDGVYHQSDVYINGKHLGFHPYGYSGFEYDLTPFLNFGGKNTLAVKVDHSDSPSSRWYSGSGIYRHVWLQVTNPIRVATWGTYISTPKVSKESAAVTIATAIENVSSKGENIQLQNKIFDADGKELVSSKLSVSVEQGNKKSFDQVLQVENPKLWSIENPYLYTMETSLKVNGKIVDQYKTSFGIRYLNFDSDKGFSLNGENIKLKGVCLHQDAGSLGTAVPDKSYLRRLQILKEYGCNAIRCSHNPPSPEFLDICDSLGFVVIDEAFDKWKSGYYSKYFDEWWQKDMDAMLLRDRNHPSIILWSIGNETSEQDEKSENGTNRAIMLRDYIHKVDPSRLVTAAIRPTMDRTYNKTGFAKALDVVGYNYQEPWLTNDKKQFPDRIMYISEAYPYYRGSVKAYKDYFPQNPWYDVANNDFVFGQFIWAGIDYLGESSGFPSTGWPTGLFDECMFEKPRAAFHRSVWNNQPMVKIAVADQSLNIDPGKDHWSWPNLIDHWNFPQYEGHIIEVQTITNCDSVGIWVNEKSMGKRRTSDYTNNTIVWHVPYKKGKIEAKGYNLGKEVAHFELKTAEEPFQIKLMADSEIIKADGQDLVHIAIQVLDKNGVVVPNSDRKISIEVSGAGRLIGLDNGDLRRKESFPGNTIETYFGNALATIQSNRSQGKIVLKVTSEGLTDSYLSIITR